MHKRLEIKCVALHNKLLRVVWNVFRIVFFRPFPTKLFWPLRWCVLKLFGAKVSILRKLSVSLQSKIKATAETLRVKL